MNVFIKKSKSELRRACQSSRVHGFSNKTVYFHILPIGGGLELVADSGSKLLFLRNAVKEYFFVSECADKNEFIEIAYDILNNKLSDFDPSLHRNAMLYLSNLFAYS